MATDLFIEVLKILSVNGVENPTPIAREIVKMLDYEVIQRMTEIIMEYENRIKTLEG
jgi:hypothetical protein